MRPEGSRRELPVPAPALVVLVGASGSGKSTFARTHFRSTEAVSSDACRALVGDDPYDRTASQDAFELLHFVVRKRLGRRRLAVVDATNVREAERAPLLVLARGNGVPAVAIVLALPLHLCLERNAARAKGRVPEAVVREQVRDLEDGLERIRAEGFALVHLLASPDEVEAAVVVREGLPASA